MEDWQAHEELDFFTWWAAKRGSTIEELLVQIIKESDETKVQTEEYISDTEDTPAEPAPEPDPDDRLAVLFGLPCIILAFRVSPWYW